MKNIPTTACPELDALIAERVFGWTDVYLPQDETQNQGRPPDDDEPEKGLYWVVPYSSGSTLTDDCGLIVEAMEKKGWTVCLGTSLNEYYCDFFKAGNMDPIKTPTHKTFPLAICLAALTALEGDGGK